MPDTLKITPHESLTIRSSTPEMLEVEATWGPGGKPPPKHFHPAHDEHFRVLTGTLRANVDGAEQTLDPGDELDVPRGAVHQMWNPGDEPASAIWQSKPAGRTEEWFRAIDSLIRGGRVGEGEMPSALAFAPYLTEYDDVIRLSGPPQPVMRRAISLLAVVGRLRGYRPGPTRPRS